MYTSLFLVLSSFALGSSAAPSHRRRYSDSVGANYFQTNNFGGNQLVSSYIMADGSLKPGTATWTNGNGSAGISDPDPFMNHPDPHYGSASVIVAGNEVMCVNAGSNTFSVFGIDNADPARPTFKATYPTGEFPTSLAASPDGKIVCALTSGADNGFGCFTAGESGWMAQPDWDRKFGLNLTTPPHGPVGGTPSQIKFASDMSNLFVAVKGKLPTDLNNPSGEMQMGAIYAYALTWSDGSWSLASEPQMTAAPAPFSIDENKFASGSYFASDVAMGFDVMNLGSGNDTAVPGVIPDESAACWAAQSDVSHNFYVVDIGGLSNITEVTVDPMSLFGQVVSSQPLGVNASGTDAVIFSTATSNVDWLYVNAVAYNQVHTFAIRGPGDFGLASTWDITKDMPEGWVEGGIMVGQALYYKC